MVSVKATEVHSISVGVINIYGNGFCDRRVESFPGKDRKGGIFFESFSNV